MNSSMVSRFRVDWRLPLRLPDMCVFCGSPTSKVFTIASRGESQRLDFGLLGGTKRTTWKFGPKSLNIPYCERCHRMATSFKHRLFIFGWLEFICGFIVTLSALFYVVRGEQITNGLAISLFVLALIITVFLTSWISAYLAENFLHHVIPSGVYADMKRHAALHQVTKPYDAFNKSWLYTPGFSYRYLSSPPVTEYVAEVGITTPFAYDHFVRLNYFTDIEKHLSGKVIS